MKNEAIISQLNQCYSAYFANCPNNPCYREEKLLNMCKQQGDHYCCSYSGRIGVNYSDESLKVLIVGQEKPDCISKQAELLCPDCYNPHWMRTKLTCYKIFHSNDEDMNEIEANRDALKDVLNDTINNICFTNYYKCAYTTDKNYWSGKKMLHSKAMQKHCGDLLFKEMCTLQPDLIIKQGKYNSDSFEDKLGNGKQLEVVDIHTATTLFKYKYTIGDIQKNLFIIYTYHPCARGRVAWKNHKNDLYKCIEKVKQEISTL